MINCYAALPHLSKGGVLSLDFLGTLDHRPQAADIHLHNADFGGGVRGQQGITNSSGFAQVPTRQTQVKLIVFCQQPIAKGQPDATEETIQAQGLSSLKWSDIKKHFSLVQKPDCVKMRSLGRQKIPNIM